MAQVGPWFVVAIIALLGHGLMIAAVASEADEPDDQDPPPILHLRGDRSGGGLHYNYTTTPPQDEAAAHVEPCDVLLRAQAQWCWQMHRAPVPWTLEPGANVQTIVHFAHLDRVPLGTIHPDNPGESGKLRVDAVLTKGSYHEAARGSAYVDPALLTGTAQARLEIHMEVTEETQWNTTPGDAPAVELQIHLHGLVRRDDPPTITTGAIDMDSHLILPGFPLQEFQAWEENQTLQDACRQRLAEQASCDPTLPGTADNTTSLVGTSAEAPLVGLPLLLFLVALTLGLTARHRKTGTT